MKIIIPILGFGRAGGYRVLSELATAWTRHGHEVTFYAHYSSAPPYFPTQAKICWLDDSGKRIDGSRAGTAPPRRGFKFVAINLQSLLRGLNRYAHNADVILANHSLTAWPVFLSRVAARKCYYIQAYEPEYYQNKPGFSQRILEKIALGSYFLPLTRIVNAPIYTRYKQIRAEHVVPPGLDFSIMFPKEQGNADWATRSIILGCIGRVEPEKGTQYVVEAYKIMLERGYCVQLHVAYGNVPALPGCRVIVPANDRELGEYYRALDILVAPGTVQLGAAHYPVLEGMACGVPVITTGYMPATTEAQNAWIVPVADAVAIADAVHAIVTQPNDRVQRVRKALVDIQPFAWPNIAAHMLEVFEHDPRA